MYTPKDFWNFRAQRYDEQVGFIYADAYRRTAENTLKYLNPTDQVLEFACGTGIVTTMVAPHVSHIQAIDIADEMVVQAQQKIDKLSMSNVQIAQLDLFDSALDESSFDAVMAFNVLLYVDNFDTVMARIHKLLKPGGVFLSATDCLGLNLSKAAIKKFWLSRTGKMPYVAFFTQNSLRTKIAASGFEVLQTENLFFSPPNLFVAAKKK